MKPITGARLAEIFDAPDPFTIGLEEEVMLLDPVTGALTDRAEEVLARLDDGFKLELPASQVEIVTPPRAEVAHAMRDLEAARRRVLDACAGIARPAVAGVHPFSPVEGRLNTGPRYDRTATEYGTIARRQLVCALQVHVAVGGADRTLAVYNGLRRHLPEIAALAANAPVYDGRISDLASMRPKLSEQLPRQGIPPAFASWDAVAAELRWGAAMGAVADPGAWWWELRPHLDHGTLELRVPDAQTTVPEAAAVATVCHGLVVMLAETGANVDPVPAWRIEENRWSACRDGVEGTLADLDTGERRPTRSVLHALLDRVEPFVDAGGIDSARDLIERNGAMRQRSVARERGVPAVADWLAERFVS